MGWLGLPVADVFPLAPALTSSCWRLRDSLSIDTPVDPVCFGPLNFRVIFGGSGAGILNLTLG